MTLRPPATPEPVPADDQSSRSGEWWPEMTGTNRTLRAALSSWGHTWRLVILTVTVLGLLIAGIWLLRVNIEFGPLKVTGR